MDEFLRDNPDFGTNSQDQTPSSRPNSNSAGTGPNTGSSENSNFAGDLDPMHFGMSGLSQTVSNDGYGNANFYSDPRDDFLSPTTSYSNEANTFGLSYDPQMEELYTSASYPQNASQQQPLQQQFNAFQSLSPNLGSPSSSHFQAGYINPSNTTNLDELISPSSTINGGGGSAQDSGSSFLNPQYFSPPTKGGLNYNGLNPIAEGDDNINTPLGSRHGSISIPFGNNSNQNNVGGVDMTGYLSPSAYMSPQNNLNSADLLRSPSYGNNGGINVLGGGGGGAGSYLNSPPEFTGINIVSPNNPSGGISIPQSNTVGSINDSQLLSPPTGRVSTSPSSNSSRQMTKEEKLKRRREFHNAVERRRRDLIKERIKQLGLLVPPSLLNPQLVAVQTLQRNSQYNSREVNELISNVKAKESKPNKSTILNKSVDYVAHLEYVLEQQKSTRERLEEEIKELEDRLNGIQFNSTNSTIASSTISESNLGSNNRSYNNNHNNNSNISNNKDNYNPEYIKQQINTDDLGYQISNPISETTPTINIDNSNAAGSSNFDPDDFFQTNSDFIDDVYNVK
ncbi:hypothetical protein CAAN1_06S05710 [[Candida] anglica]|uniref:BHLH domain-containing protein n=1 Tax=[Candida] anglica TaxID=148631 RepID=A0ABP0EML6_9ASCO